MTALRSLAGAQALVIAVVLIAAGAAKLPSAAIGDLVRTSALTSAAGSARRSRLAWRTIAVVEVAIGLCVALVPSAGWPLVLAASVLALGLVYTLVSERIRPGSPCGCFGSSTVSGWQSSLRTSVLLVCCGVGLAATESWRTAVGNGAVWPLLAVEVLALAWLFPERHGVGPAVGRRVLRWRRGLDKWRLGHECANAAGPPASETRLLSRTAVWARVSDYLSASEASDVWREGCWEFATFAGRYQGGPATVVFGIPLDPFARTRTVAVVDETEGAVVLREEMLDWRN